jgi:hypothetical protein
MKYYHIARYKICEHECIKEKKKRSNPCKASQSLYNVNITTLYYKYLKMINEITREQEQAQYKAKYKENWAKNREAKAQEKEIKTNDQWQIYVEWFWWVNP